MLVKIVITCICILGIVGCSGVVQDDKPQEDSKRKIINRYTQKHKRDLSPTELKKLDNQGRQDKVFDSLDLLQD